MTVQEAQLEMQTIYKGGYVGQMVSGIIWLISAALGAFVSVQAGLISLFALGAIIFPITQLSLKLAGQPASLSSGNPLQGLAKQIAFIVPLCLPVIAAAALYQVEWYYPAFMVVVGAHYLPFVFMYGMRQYAALAGALIVAGVLIGMYLPGSFALGGWVGGLLMLGFGVFTWTQYRRRS